MEIKPKTPRQEIEELVKNHRLEEAQRKYWEEINKERRHLIRL